MQVSGKVVDQELFAVGLTVLTDDRAVEVEHKHLDAAALPRLPHIPGQVEEHGLEKEHEAHPLVVFVVLDLVFSVHVGRDARLDDVFANAATDTVGYGERRVNPTIRVHDVERHIVDDAIDRVTDVLTGRDEQRERHQNDDSRLVVQSEYVIVDTYAVDFQQPLDGAEHVEHGGGGFKRELYSLDGKHTAGSRNLVVDGSGGGGGGRRDEEIRIKRFQPGLTCVTGSASFGDGRRKIGRDVCVVCARRLAARARAQMHTTKTIDNI